LDQLGLVKCDIFVVTRSVHVHHGSCVGLGLVGEAAEDIGVGVHVVHIGKGRHRLGHLVVAETSKVTELPNIYIVVVRVVAELIHFDEVV